MTRILGCDPGLHGAFGLWDDDLDVLVVRDVPVLHVQVGRSENRAVLNDAEIAATIRELCPDHIVIEEVNGVRGQSASASFNFGASFGVLRGCAAALDVPVTFVPPAVWRARLRVRKGKDGSRLRASQLWPRQAALFSRVKDHDRADACLIARSCPAATL